jgi:hypothetical protein
MMLTTCGLTGYTIVDAGSYAQIAPADPAVRILDRTITLTPGVRLFKDVAAEVVQQLTATMGHGETPFFSLDGNIGHTRSETRVEVPAGGPRPARDWLQALVPLPIDEWWRSSGLEIQYDARVVWLQINTTDRQALILKIVDRTDYHEVDGSDWESPYGIHIMTRLEFLESALPEKMSDPEWLARDEAIRQRDIAMYERLIAEEKERLAREAAKAGQAP